MYWDQFSRRHRAYCWLAAIFISSLILANLIGSYLFEVKLPFPLPFIGNRGLLSAGIVPFPITFILTDLVNEYYGTKGAKEITYIGFGMSILVYLYLIAAQHLPIAPETIILPNQYNAFANNYASMFIASLTAYLIGQLLDIKLFGIFKAITGNNFLWFRATGSTVLSQLFDSFIVTTIAFYGNLSFDKILLVAISNYIWKFVISVGITPLLYVGHILLKQFLHLEPEKVQEL